MPCCHHRSPCAPFTPPVNPDQGQCFPLPEVRDCEAPVLPGFDCSDNAAAMEYDPTQTPSFRAISTLFDSTCDPISDDISGDPILTLSV